MESIDLVDVRLECGSRLRLAVDDAIGTVGGDGAALSEFEGRISTMSLISSSALASSSSRIMVKLEGGSRTSIIHRDVDGISTSPIVKPSRRVLFLLK